MDKNAIKKYAVWARNELIARVTQKAEQYEITEKKTTPKDADSINGRLLTEAEKNQRKALIEKIQADGFEQVMEEVAYTWFNRFTALRFMEVNNYLPSHTRVFTNEAGEFKPQILADAIQLDLEGLDMDKVFELKDANKTEELYKYLLITQCNALSSILPRMFQKIEHYTELLLPDYLLREGSVIEQMITLIPEEDWTDQVQIIGWLYQYYTTEQNELVYDGSWARARIKKDLLPAATTIYTPDWSVRYMVENSLGRLWAEGHPDTCKKANWKYYLEEAEQTEEVNAKLKQIRDKYSKISPESIRCIDPCSGSGHILCYMFDILVQIYEDYGYTVSEAVHNIVEKNLYGLDIDDRAAQLAYFSVMMKARSYDRRFFARKDANGQLNIPQPNVMSVPEGNGIEEESLNYLGRTLSSGQKAKAYKEALKLKKEFSDAKEYGSILKVSEFDWQLLKEFVKDDGNNGQQRLDVFGELEAADILSSLISVGIILTQKYDVVVTNPPYLNSNRFSPVLDKYVNANYPDEKTDLSMVMLRKALDDFCKPDGFVSFITTSSWMFLQSFEKVRKNILNGHCIDSIVDYGTELFEGKVGHNPITSWVSRKSKINRKMTALRLVEFCYSRRDEKEPEFFNKNNRYYTSQDAFEVIPGTPIAYWASNSMIDAFKTGQCVNDFADPKQGLATADNNRFLRLWFEVSTENIYLECNDHESASSSSKKWYPYNKGGGFKKWYGNNAYLINWQHDGTELKAFKGSVIRSPQFYFKECGSWCKVTSASFSMRYIPKGFLFDVAGCSLFVDDNNLKYVIAFMNSKVNKAILGLISPTLNYEVGHVASLPVIFDETRREQIETLCEDSIRICKEDWDSFELSWDFRRHPLIREVSTIEEAYKLWDSECKERFAKLKANEEELNRIFIDIYNMQEDMNPEESDDEVTVRLADKQREIKSLISYAVGCMFGRYSLDKDGVLYAGGQWDASLYQYFKVDNDNIIPICDDEYFSDDIVNRFISFIEIVYGERALEENLNYIAECLGGKGSSRDIIRNYFINDFYSDHCSVYSVAGSGKRPIYWQFDSGKKNGFKCLIYMHRYRPDTIARIRTDYVHEQQSRYRTAIEAIESQISEAGASDRVKLNKKLTLLNDQASEIRVFEEKIHHLADQMINIDLDDGIKSNYAIFKDVLSKIK